jgi:Flp pilus assembly protein TadG
MLASMMRPRGQSLIEFAVLLPAVLILILLIVRMMMILNVWYSVTQTANIAVRAAALTGDAYEACKIVTENLIGFAPDRLQLHIQFGADQKADCKFVYTQINSNRPTPTPLPPDVTVTPEEPTPLPPVSVTVDPPLPTFVPPVRPSVTPVTPVPGASPPPTVTPDLLAATRPENLLDAPIRVEIVYEVQIAGAFLPEWKLPLRAAAWSRLESRIKVIPTPTPDFF